MNKPPQVDAHELKWLVRDDPKKAASIILALYEQNACMWRTVAKKLGIHYVTLYRWVQMLNIPQQVARVKKRNQHILSARTREYGRKGGRLGGWTLGKLRGPRKKMEMQR